MNNLPHRDSQNARKTYENLSRLNSANMHFHAPLLQFFGHNFTWILLKCMLFRVLVFFRVDAQVLRQLRRSPRVGGVSADPATVTPPRSQSPSLNNVVSAHNITNIPTDRSKVKRDIVRKKLYENVSIPSSKQHQQHSVNPPSPPHLNVRPKSSPSPIVAARRHTADTASSPHQIDELSVATSSSSSSSSRSSRLSPLTSSSSSKRKKRVRIHRTLDNQTLTTYKELNRHSSENLGKSTNAVPGTQHLSSKNPQEDSAKLVPPPRQSRHTGTDGSASSLTRAGIDIQVPRSPKLVPHALSTQLHRSSRKGGTARSPASHNVGTLQAPSVPTGSPRRHSGGALDPENAVLSHRVLVTSPSGRDVTSSRLPGSDPQFPRAVSLPTTSGTPPPFNIQVSNTTRHPTKVSLASPRNKQNILKKLGERKIWSSGSTPHSSKPVEKHGSHRPHSNSRERMSRSSGSTPRSESDNFRVPNKPRGSTEAVRSASPTRPPVTRPQSAGVVSAGASRPHARPPLSGHRLKRDEVARGGAAVGGSERLRQSRRTHNDFPRTIFSDGEGTKCNDVSVGFCYYRCEQSAVDLLAYVVEWLATC